MELQSPLDSSAQPMPALSGLPTTAQNELWRRKLHAMLLAGLFMLGLVMPVLSVVPPPRRDPWGRQLSSPEWRLVHPELSSFIEQSPAQAFSLVLIVAGLAIMGPALAYRPRGFGIALLATSAGTAAFAGLVWYLMAGLVEMPVPAPSPLLGPLIFSMIAGVCLLAGIRARWYRPMSLPAMWVGLVGSIGTVLVMVIPIPGLTNGLPLAVHSIKVILDGPTWTVAPALLASLLGLVPVAICIVNVRMTNPSRARWLARWVFICWIGGAAITGLVAIMSFGIQLSHLEAPAMAWLSSAMTIVKGGAYGLAVALVLPVALTDIIVGRPERCIAREFHF